MAQNLCKMKAMNVDGQQASVRRIFLRSVRWLKESTTLQCWKLHQKSEYHMHRFRWFGFPKSVGNVDFSPFHRWSGSETDLRMWKIVYMISKIWGMICSGKLSSVRRRDYMTSAQSLGRQECRDESLEKQNFCWKSSWNDFLGLQKNIARWYSPCTAYC